MLKLKRQKRCFPADAKIKPI